MLFICRELKSSSLESELRRLANIGRKLASNEVEHIVNPLLESHGFEISRTQPNTDGDGNCFLHAILDQLR